MKSLGLLCGLLVVIGCGGSGSKEVASGENTIPSAGSPDVSDPAGDGGSAAQEPQDGGEEQVLGAWENASCGDRKYLRKISFLPDGRFFAVDEVAPCPQNAKCVYSGVIPWHGTWTLSDKVIALEVDFKSDTKKPEILPDGFVVLSGEPCLIGERDGDLVCPYRKRK